MKALNGSGKSISSIDYNKVKITENNSIDHTNADAVTIPGAVAAWTKINQDYGKFSLEEILKPAINLAENGYIVADVVADMWKREADKLKKTVIVKICFEREGTPYSTGEIHFQQNLAKTLKEISKAGNSGFYDGWVAEDIVSKLKSCGGSHTLKIF